MSKAVTKEPVTCPRCGSDTYAWGHAIGHRHLQRYRCKNPNCRRQFTPGLPERTKKYPTMPCPKCGGKMSIFKFLSDGYRLRCNNHIHKDKRHCNHKVNVPLPGKSFKIAKDPIECIQTELSVKFSWPKMSFSNSSVSLVLYFAVFMSIPATQVAKIMRDLYRVKISHDTITRWTHKAALNIHKNLGPLSVPKARGRRRTLTDETGFKVRGQKRWVWMTKESRFDSEQSWFISPKRSTEYARSLFNIAFTASPCLKNIQALTDGLWSYSSALGDLGFDSDKHKVYHGFFESPNNNRRERSWSTLKVKARPFRGFKSDLGLWSFVALQGYYLHNYFKPNIRLKGLTPAEASGSRLPYCHSYWKLFLKFL
jgi:transposase-like protein/DNA-directed RNA polymerase subunit RPC12/RpoP